MPTPLFFVLIMQPASSGMLLVVPRYTGDRSSEWGPDQQAPLRCAPCFGSQSIVRLEEGPSGSGFPAADASLSSSSSSSNVHISIMRRACFSIHSSSMRTRMLSTWPCERARWFKRPQRDNHTRVWRMWRQHQILQGGMWKRPLCARAEFCEAQHSPYLRLSLLAPVLQRLHRYPRM